MARLDVSGFDAFLKEIYPAIEIELVAANNHPLLAQMPKADDFGGDALVVPILYGNPAGRSADYSTARTNANTTKQTKFVLTERKKDYNVVQIESEVIMASNKGNYSFAEAKALEIKHKLEELGKSLSIAMFRSGTGQIGTVSAIGNGSGTADLLTLSNPSDVLYFSEGQVLNFIDSDGSLLQNSGADAQATVERVDLANGQIEVDADTSAFTEALAVNDGLVTDGDDDAKVAGLAGWLPLTAPTSGDSWFSVDRSVNVAALSGHRVDNTGRSIFQNGQELAMRIGEYGGRPDVWVMNPRAGLQLAAELDTKVERMAGGTGTQGFNGFELVNFMVPGIKVMFDYTCPPDRAYMLQLDTWKFHHLGGVPHIMQDDGLYVIRSTSFDGVECYARYYGELACRAPGFNGVMSVATS